MWVATNSKANDLAWGITLGACWFWTCRQLSLAWVAYPNYEFGYCVPWIALFLAWRRIVEMPGCLKTQSPARGGARFLSGAALVLAWALFLFAELVREFDPHWRMVSWVMMASVTLLTVGVLWDRGDGKLVKHLGFPLAFVWTAVPWPTIIEEAVTLKLRAFVTSATVSALHWMGVSAWHQGNVVHLAGGSVVIDSACSGITSFQSTLMAALFLGEFFRFRAGRRILLLTIGASIAVMANLARATTLAWLANRGGPDTLAAYHDPAGHLETGAILLALAAAAWLLSWKKGARCPESDGAPSASQEGSSRLERGASTLIWSGNDGFAALVAFGSIPFLAWGWFALSPGGPIRSQKTPRWSLKARPTSTAWRIQPTTLSKTDLQTLDCTAEQTMSLAGPANATVYHFFWKTNSGTGFGHTPDVCMAGVGWQKKGEAASVSLRIKEAEFPCKVYRFARDREEIVVFQSVWYGGDPLLPQNDFSYNSDVPRASRLALLWSGPRRQGLESLNIYLAPAADLATETRMAEEVLAQVLVHNP